MDSREDRIIIKTEQLRDCLVLLKNQPGMLKDEKVLIRFGADNGRNGIWIYTRLSQALFCETENYYDGNCIVVSIFELLNRIDDHRFRYLMEIQRDDDIGIVKVFFNSLQYYICSFDIDIFIQRQQQSYTWGGKRTGAGRKTDDPRKKVSIRIPESILSKIDNIGSRTEIIEKAVLDYLSDTKSLNTKLSQFCKEKMIMALDLLGRSATQKDLIDRYMIMADRPRSTAYNHIKKAVQLDLIQETQEGDGRLRYSIVTVSKKEKCKKEKCKKEKAEEYYKKRHQKKDVQQAVKALNKLGGSCKTQKELLHELKNMGAISCQPLIKKAVELGLIEEKAYYDKFKAKSLRYSIPKEDSAQPKDLMEIISEHKPDLKSFETVLICDLFGFAKTRYQWSFNQFKSGLQRLQSAGKIIMQSHARKPKYFIEEELGIEIDDKSYISFRVINQKEDKS